MRERSLVLTKENRQKSRVGDKTHTRRLIRPQPEGAWARHYPNVIDGCYADGECKSDLKAPWQVGDHLWMLEPYQVERTDAHAIGGIYCDDQKPFVVELTDSEMSLWGNRKYPFRKTSSRYMYKSLARTWFEVTAVRAERLQDITAEDCVAEGIHYDLGKIDNSNAAGHGPHATFKTLWDSINKKRGFGWDKNPWVWVYEYKKITKSESGG